MTVSAKVNGMGLGKTDEWYTPQSVFTALGERFDLDPAHPAFGMTSVPTRTYYSRDGLDLAWFGFVWLNPPFGGRGAIEPWLDRFFLHGNGIALTPDRTSAPWFHRAWPKADAVLFTRKIRFIDSNGIEGGSPANGTTLWASGERAVAALRRAASNGLGLFALTSEPVADPTSGDVVPLGRTTLSRPSEGVCTSPTIETGEGTGGLHDQRKGALPQQAMEPFTHRDLSQHADKCVTNRNEIVVPHGEVF